MSHLSRRELLCAVAASIGVAPVVVRGAARKKIPIGVQLYSVGGPATADLPGTLAAIRKMGYDGVEFAGYYNKTAKELRQLLDDNGLKACGTHTGLNTMTGGQLEPTIEFNQILGNRFLIAPSLPKPNIATLDAWAKTAETFNEIAAKLKPLGMAAGFHNHLVEFQPLEGQIPAEYFCARTSRDVIFQLDVGHAVHAGADPVAFIRKFPGRSRSVHIKEWTAANKAYVVGEGDVNWPPVFDACESVGATEWYVIEEETRAFQGVEGIEKSIQSLRRLLA
ncbi:MAG: sugar phosphate isomerase/epimerase [Bryobacterales bacterium]|nr:sugar phosphate isomerase/epimerase [Bryobacterales bacterium]